MKIIIFLLLFTVQAQYNDDEEEAVTDNINLITRMISLNTNSQFTLHGGSLSTVIPDVMSSNGVDTSQTWPFSFTNNLDLVTPSGDRRILIEEQWFNVNQSHRRDSSSRSFLYWKRTNDRSRKGANYILTSDPRCIRQMCSIKLKYNSTLSARTSGCLSFSLRTRGQPVGQLWIVEDQEPENMLQKIQLINKTLRIEHTLRSKIRNLSIEAKILFRNPQKDALILTNLNVNWKGSCPKTRRVPTPSPHLIDRRATLEDDFMTLSSEGSGLMNTLTTNDEFQSSQEHLIYDSTTIRSSNKTKTKRPFSFLSQENIGWFLSLVAVSCFLVVLSAGGHSFWLIRRYHHFTWHVPFDTQIQFLARRSIRSSTRSENKIATVSQIAYDILNSDLQKDTSITNSDRSTPMSYYTYL